MLFFFIKIFIIKNLSYNTHMPVFNKAEFTKIVVQGTGGLTHFIKLFPSYIELWIKYCVFWHFLILKLLIFVKFSFQWYATWLYSVKCDFQQFWSIGVFTCYDLFVISVTFLKVKGNLLGSNGWFYWIQEVKTYRQIGINHYFSSFTFFSPF